MRFAPLSEEELTKEPELLTPGVHDMYIKEAKDATSKKGNEMIVLTLVKEGKYVTDYLMEKVPYKLRHACYAADIGHKYEGGDIQGWMFEKKTVTVKVDIEPASNGYSAKNKIVSYLTTTASKNEDAENINQLNHAPAPAATQTEGKPAELDDDIPF
jgi:hypothetical protein